ncbi:hypothetical protein B0H16DRAFT_1718382 [Mycena metata]|uniref:Ribonuclease H1 N-terminal domain-containing protein n=1 Tax=Mycena metata TaxID=1033252 RepID=A0AAD7JFN9_9AGAR|nr:hypothetical protein B0H16DRAFT_1718382 [Mycena metata]
MHYQRNALGDDWIPDTLNPDHDPKFWCLPKIHDAPSESHSGGYPMYLVTNGRELGIWHNWFWCLPKIHDAPSESHSGGYPMYLVTNGRELGIWHNWTVAEKMVKKYSGNAYRGHHTLEGCIKEWQLHCALGSHPHPVDPALIPSKSPVLIPPKSTVLPKSTALQPNSLYFPSTSSKAGTPSTYSDSLSSTGSSVTATTWADVPTDTKYWALWRGRIVYTSRSKAKDAFLLAESAGMEPSILCCADYDEAQAFANGCYWIHD